MKAIYDKHTDALTLVLREAIQIDDSEEVRPGIILDCDANGHLVAIVVMDASQRVSQPDRVELELD